MAIYHLQVSTGSKLKGHSAGAKAMYLQREGKYQRQEDKLEHCESHNMPSWAEHDPTAYWQAADLHERSNGRLYKEVEFALPRELDQEARLELARSFAHELTEGERLPYTLALHQGRDGDGGQGNPHAHLLISERMNDGLEREPAQWFGRFNRAAPELGGAEKTESLKPRTWLEGVREQWAQEANQALERNGLEVRIDHRTLEAQGIDRIPTLHLGPHALAMEERGLASERGERFMEIVNFNERRLELERGLEHEHERALEKRQEIERGLDWGNDLSL